MTTALYILALAALSVVGRNVWVRKSRAGRRLAQLRRLHQP
jgi:hypothetical protein